jgi:hypothetical protein
MIAPFPFVSVSGSPFQRGYQYGAAVPGRVHGSARLYGGQLSELGLSERGRSRLIAECLGQIEDFDPAYLEEMRGVAEGARIDLEQVVMINARTEVVSRARVLAGRPQSREEEAEDQAGADGCTGAVILPERSRNGNLLHGQNWDWRPECVDTAIVLRMYRDDGPDVITFVEAGGLGRHGMNAAGVAVSGNYLRCDRDYTTEGGVPLALVRPQGHGPGACGACDAGHRRDPEGLRHQHDRQPQGRLGHRLRMRAGRSLPALPGRRLLVHANHWVSPTALLKLRDTGITTAPDSLYRDWRVRGCSRVRRTR